MTFLSMVVLMMGLMIEGVPHGVEWSGVESLLFDDSFSFSNGSRHRSSMRGDFFWSIHASMNEWLVDKLGCFLFKGFNEDGWD